MIVILIRVCSGTIPVKLVFVYVSEGAVEFEDGEISLGYSESGVVRDGNSVSVTATEDSILIAFCLDLLRRSLDKERSVGSRPWYCRVQDQSRTNYNMIGSIV